VAVNLFLIGLVGGKMLSGPEEEVKRANATRGYSLHPRVMLQALPEARAEDVRAFYADARKGMGGEWRAINGIRREVDAALRAEPFDREAFIEARRREVQARMDLRMRSHSKTADFITTMTPDERVELADFALRSLDEQTAYWRERARKRREAEGR
jgi:uncharacterized membrane protein